ncbi:MAG: hypothetical protein IJ511_04695 [Bacteroides sp.]|nr:hypothetical protein [Bacteroides sp.]
MKQIFHPMTLVVNPSFEALRPFVASVPDRFERGEGSVIYQGRNELRVMEHEGKRYVVKSFHAPHLINRFVYGIFRPSKAKRSYDNAVIYLSIGVGTPAPVGYVNVRSGLLFDRSYYISEESRCPHVYSELFERKFPYEDEVMRAIGRVTATLHEHGYAHKDYGRGNILFGRDEDGTVRIEIVDLNRMHVGRIGLKAGCKNLERLPATPRMHALIAEEYARLRGFDAEECCRLMAAYRRVQPGLIDGKY